MTNNNPRPETTSRFSRLSRTPGERVPSISGEMLLQMMGASKEKTQFVYSAGIYWKGRNRCTAVVSQALCQKITEQQLFVVRGRRREEVRTVAS